MPNDKQYLNQAVEAAIRIGLIALILIWCFHITEPFIIPIIWGIIIAVAAHPGYRRLLRATGERTALAATLVVVIGLVVLIVPALLLSGTLIEAAHGMAKGLQTGTIAIPPPPDYVRTWPFVGESLSSFWQQASDNLGEALRRVAPQLKGAGTWLLSAAAGVTIGVLQLLVAIVIAGVMLANDSGGERITQALARRVAGVRGPELATLAKATVRSVTRGILGVALIQSLLAGLGFLAVGIPGAGLWALLCLILSAVQIGIFLIAVPALIYVVMTADPVTIVLYGLWTLLTTSIDNVLKPILLGRGVELPMAVIFVGAIGGFIANGIIGLFVGAVVLALGYKLFLAWLYDPQEGASDEPQDAPPATAVQASSA